jgi:hypothetical protein
MTIYLLTKWCQVLIEWCHCDVTPSMDDGTLMRNGLTGHGAIARLELIST